MPRPTTKQPEPNDLLLRQNNEYATCGAFVDGSIRHTRAPTIRGAQTLEQTSGSRTNLMVRVVIGDSTAPSCVPVFFTDIDYYYYGCAATFPDDPWYATLSPEGDIDDDRTTTTTKTEPAVDIESGFSSNTRTSESTTGTGSSPTPTDDPSPPDETSSTGAIVGGVAGGVAAIAAAAGAWFLLRRRNKKDQEKPNESSFIVLGSNLQPSSSRMENAKNQVPGADGTKSEPFAFLNTTTEGPTNSLDQPRGTPPMPPMPVPSPSPDMAPAYQPYNPS
ncbi:hypothetical protein OHC33_001816 [Knufia fluminis]|uniref:Uncharacterized protein n=1 Tax=Knufia fluminis TaxID=191047 RepID=A0AAN8IRT5_9EURO|nr:hypothetical protein OHC33_001816 [Knufia fluminis]